MFSSEQRVVEKGHKRSSKNCELLDGYWQDEPTKSVNMLQEAKDCGAPKAFFAIICRRQARKSSTSKLSSKNPDGGYRIPNIFEENRSIYLVYDKVPKEAQDFLLKLRYPSSESFYA